MARPAIVWRNPNSVPLRRVWNRVKREPARSLYLVVESEAFSDKSEWKGLPNLEVIRGDATRVAREVRESKCLPSGA